MEFSEGLARVRALSDGDLLSSLQGVVRALRRSAAEVVAHLSEVEERRLHLLAGHASMFMYCVSHLGMSEDEAWRRMEVARLARRFPRLFELLACGQISLSVAALLRRHLTAANAEVLLADVCGKTVSEAREVLARWFPRADVPSCIRKLPARQPLTPPVTGQMMLPSQVGGASLRLAAPSSGASKAALSPGGDGIHGVDVFSAMGDRPSAAPLVHTDPLSACGQPAEGGPPPSGASSLTPSCPLERALAQTDAPPADGAPQAYTLPLTAASMGGAPPLAGVPRETSAPADPARAPIQPLSPDRYRIQLLASSDLKRKLELARDLLRHSLPSADWPVIVERALDVLIEHTMKRRFGTKTRVATDARPAATEPSNAQNARGPSTSTGTSMNAETHCTSSPQGRCPPARYIPSDVRRIVLARDGARCTWRGPDGTRCNCRAWLELDHIIPRSLGGSNDPANIRLLCRFHNRLAAEQAFGRRTIERIVARRQQRPSRTREPPAADDTPTGEPQPRAASGPTGTFNRSAQRRA
jgi:hypothetical protein